MKLKSPSPGESITEVLLAKWFVEDGDQVEKDQELGEVESDKATLPLISGITGAISIVVPEGETVKIGATACKIDSEKTGKSRDNLDKKPEEPTKSVQPESSNKKTETEKSVPQKETPEKNQKTIPANDKGGIKATPLARKLMEEHQVSVEDIINGLQKITSQDVDLVLKNKQTTFQPKEVTGSRDFSKQKMSPLRKKLAERLVAVKNETAMLTTFNEVDMSAVMNLRKKYQSKFEAKYGTKVGFMSFFAKAVCEALKLHPMVNSQIDGDAIITPAYYDIGIAVSTDKGLMVPVLRNVETMSLADIENSIAALASKARAGRISLDEMSGGTFTITNGGVFGSMLSTPIINPPQSAILGMHNIIERPVAIEGKVEIRPVMYIALSYDHRIIDGKDSVGFLVKVKQFIENPVKLLFGESSPEEYLLGI
ncbi:MAG: 2-oxoglutarate dehydrogenase complex dihydrolipoyllysine-residue succinyltransferase [Bacteroidetes bacterium]|nr:2-oxoglutarate dehydrogenase complex dihydrolipoyllysine-residue succinyltransferase [Bacteroidota bacterium]